jgi:hypothetical protein
MTPTIPFSFPLLSSVSMLTLPKCQGVLSIFFMSDLVFIFFSNHGLMMQNLCLMNHEMIFKIMDTRGNAQ